VAGDQAFNRLGSECLAKIAQAIKGRGCSVHVTIFESSEQPGKEREVIVPRGTDLGAGYADLQSDMQGGTSLPGNWQ